MDHERNAAIIVGKLASFNMPSRVVRWNAGPVVTQYEVEPDPSVKVSRIEGLADDLAMALAARTIRIEAPIPGKSVVGIEIPNMDFNVVAIRRILEDPEVVAIPSRISFALGRDVAGHARAADLARMPHLLIAGATGSGKSVMVNALIASLLMRATPDEVRLILVDPKRVELADYNGIPHLMVPGDHRVGPGAGRPQVGGRGDGEPLPALRRARPPATSPPTTRRGPIRPTALSYLVIIVDELADLMMRDGKTVEDPIVRLAQKARATGIHLVLATQRPSVNVVTGLIKANFPSRIAFAMASQIDSRTILDAPGAEDLIGRGDMLFQPSDLPRPIRLQGVFVSDKEVRAHHRPLAGRGRAALRPLDRRGRRGIERVGRRPDRRGRRPAPPGCRRGHPGVRSRLGVAPPAAPQDRLCTGRADHRPARGARLHRGVRRLERAPGPPPRRRRGGARPGRRRRRRGRRVTTREHARPLGLRGRGGDRDRGQEPRTPPPGERLADRLAAAREAKGVDLLRAERETKIRRQYLAAMERGAWEELPAGVYARGFLRNYAIYLGLDPDEVLAAWGRERGEVPGGAIHRRPAPDRGAPPRDRPGPGIIVAALVTLGALAIIAYIGFQLLRFSEPPPLTVTDPPTAVTEVAEDTTSYTLARDDRRERRGDDPGARPRGPARDRRRRRGLAHGASTCGAARTGSSSRRPTPAPGRRPRRPSRSSSRCPSPRSPRRRSSSRRPRRGSASRTGRSPSAEPPPTPPR